MHNTDSNIPSTTKQARPPTAYPFSIGTAFIDRRQQVWTIKNIIKGVAYLKSNHGILTLLPMDTLMLAYLSTGENV